MSVKLFCEEIAPALLNPPTFAARVKSSSLVIAPSVWLVIVSALTVAVAKDLISPELLREEVLMLVLLPLCKFPELVKLFVEDKIRLVFPRIFPELVKFAALAVKSVAESNSPSFCKSPVNARVRDAVSEAMMPAPLLFKLLPIILKETVANPTPKSPIKSPHFSELFSCYKWRLELVFSSAISWFVFCELVLFLTRIW